MKKKKRKLTTSQLERYFRLFNNLCTVAGCDQNRSEKNKWYCEKHRLQRIISRANYREKLRHDRTIRSTETTLSPSVHGEGESTNTCSNT
jgi:hypothetical protein